MRRSKKTVFDIIKEIISHILLIFVVLLVLLPILYVISSGFRTNQAIYGPLIDMNTWVDTNIANRRENKISKTKLINRISMVFDGMLEEDIINKERINYKYQFSLETGSPEHRELKKRLKIWVKSNGRGTSEQDFVDAYKVWASSISTELRNKIDTQIFSDTSNYKLRYKYDVRTAFTNYVSFFTGKIPNAENAYYPMVTWALNSVMIAGIVAFAQVIVTALASYVLSRFRFTGKKESLMVLLTLQVFPGTMAMVALYLLLQYLGNITGGVLGVDTKIGLILVYLGGGIPFNIWMVKGYFDTIPKALEESAVIDGATTWQAFTMIIVPLVRPILAVTMVLAFVGMYNEFVLATIVLNKQDNYTLPVGLRFFMNANQDARFGVFSAASFIGSFPIVVLWLLLQNQIIAGLTGGAVKG